MREQGPRAKLRVNSFMKQCGVHQEAAKKNPCSSSAKVIVGTVSVHLAALLENGNSRECPSLLKEGKNACNFQKILKDKD